jgi:sugar O-acyltransferase (sialic acid O-acetyltransferase NeuD family)
MTINPVIIFGAKGIATVALDIFESNQVPVYGFLDEDTTLHNTQIGELVSVLGGTDDRRFLKLIGQKCDAFIAIEDAQQRNEIVEMLLKDRKVVPVNAVHPVAYIAPSAQIGHGNLINAGAIVNSAAKLGSYNVVQSNVVIEHQAQLGHLVQIGANVTIGKGVQIDNEAVIGMGAIIMPNVKIGKKAQIGPASLVIADVPDGATVFGIPAKEV